MKTLIPIRDDYIAPRPDTATEMVIAIHYDGRLIEEPRSILVAAPSAEAFCDIVIRERITRVVCCGIEEEYYQFLHWKKVEVTEGIIGRWRDALTQAIAGELTADSIVGIDRTVA